MNAPELEPVPPELQELVDSELRMPDPAPSVQTRVGKRLEQSFRQVQAARVTAPERHSRWRAFFRRRTPAHLLTFALGGAAGAGVHALAQHQVAPVVTLVAAAAPRAMVVADAVAVTPPFVPVASATPRQNRVPFPTKPSKSDPPPPQPEPVHDGDLAAERRLLETARRAITSGEGPAALATLDEHQRGFPQGRLAEEREALRIQALVTAGRAGEAKVVGAAFRARFAGSLLLPAVQVALRSISVTEPVPPAE